MKFVVNITRNETYRHTVVVEAKDKDDAKRKVMNFDDNDGFLDEWNELDPEVETEYEAEPIETTTSDDELALAFLQEVR